VAVDGALADGDAAIGARDQFIAREHLARRAQQRGQEMEFRNGENHRVAVPARLESLLVERERPAAEDVLGGDLRFQPAQHRLGARDQLARREGLAQIVVATQLQAQHAIDLFVRRGKEDGPPRAGSCRRRRAGWCAPVP
jgi:hypothetical protein